MLDGIRKRSSRKRGEETQGVREALALKEAFKKEALDGAEAPRRGRSVLMDTFRLAKKRRIKITGIFVWPKRRIAVFVKGKRQRTRKKALFVLSVLAGVLAGLFLLWQSRPVQILSLAWKIREESIILGFQNSAELRPTGGFWGSFAMWEVGENVADSRLAFETNPYKKDNPLLEKLETELPRPMKETWPDRPQSFVNANWSLDFPTAAKTIQWYFGQGWDQSADGVIAISSLAMIDLLGLVGEVELPDGTLMNNENFTRVMSEKIDEEYWEDPRNLEINEPKTIIKEIAPEIIARAKGLPLRRLFSFLTDQLNRGRIILFFNDRDKQKIAEKTGLAGEMVPYEVDYFSLNNANLNGGKSSLNISQRVEYEVVKGGERCLARARIDRAWPRGGWPDILNRNFTRVVVPLGSKLTAASLEGEDITEGVETLDEEGRTTFGFWFSVGPAEEKTATLEYELPFACDRQKDYQLVWQKQPGTLPDNVSITVFGRRLYSGEIDQPRGTFR